MTRAATHWAGAVCWGVHPPCLARRRVGGVYEPAPLGGVADGENRFTVGRFGHATTVAAPAARCPAPSRCVASIGRRAMTDRGEEVADWCASPRDESRGPQSLRDPPGSGPVACSTSAGRLVARPR